MYSIVYNRYVYTALALVLIVYHSTRAQLIQQNSVSEATNKFLNQRAVLSFGVFAAAFFFFLDYKLRFKVGMPLVYLALQVSASMFPQTAALLEGFSALAIAYPVYDSGAIKAVFNGTKMFIKEKRASKAAGGSFA